MRPVEGKVMSVAEVEFTLPATAVVEIVDPRKLTTPATSQSPAVSDMLVTFAGVAVVSETAEPPATEAVTYSPTMPAAALLFVVTPGAGIARDVQTGEPETRERTQPLAAVPLASPGIWTFAPGAYI